MRLIHSSLLAMLVFATALGPTAVRAQSAAPPIAKDFLRYCAKDAKGCDQYIASIDFALLASSVGSVAHYCGPESFTHAVSSKVVAQLAHAPAQTLRGPTADAVRSVLAALYPCKPGVRSVAAFLKTCDAKPMDCSTDIDAVSDVLIANSDPNYCPPDPDKLTTNDIIANWAKIKTWLRAHPNGNNESRAIADAWRVRYPCVKH
jgi:hypothetical protein